MVRFIRNLKFKTRITAVFTLLLILSGTISGVMYYRQASRDTIENYMRTSEDLVANLNEHFSNRLNGITKKVYAMNSNMSYADPLREYLVSPKKTNYAVLLGNMSEFISELTGSDDYISSAYIHTDYSDFDNFVKIRDYDVSFEDTDIYSFFKNNPGDNIEWFPATSDSYYRGDETVIPVVYRFTYGRQEAYTVVNISQKRIEEYLRSTSQSFDHVFIVASSGEGVAFYSDDFKEITDNVSAPDTANKAECRRIKLSGRDYLVTTSYMNKTGWTIYAVKSAASLLSNINDLKIFVVTEIIITSIICLVLVVVLVGLMMKPLGKLASIMNSVTGKHYDVRFDYPYNNEVGNIANSFNYMINEIEEGVEALSAEKEQKRIAELKALQAQINPHFLYNTLNAITWQAADQGADEISVMAGSLGKFFRVSLSKGKEIISIAEELEHVRSYLEIQKIRYKTKFDYEIIASDSVLEYRTIKLILQPLVENSIYHGIKLKEGTGHISIRVDSMDEGMSIPVLRLQVEDNGAGIENDKLDAINNDLSQGRIESEGGYGIFNVNERIRLYFGDNYGLTFQSKAGEGTVATIIIPAVAPEADDLGAL